MVRGEMNVGLHIPGLDKQKTSTSGSYVRRWLCASNYKFKEWHWALRCVSKLHTLDTAHGCGGNLGVLEKLNNYLMYLTLINVV